MIKSLIWNIRGIGSSPSVRRLKSLIRVHQLKLVCVLEPFMSPAKLDATRVRLGMDSAFASESGKIWLFWSPPFHVQVLHDMGQVVHCRACHSSLSEGFFMSFVYAKCVASLRLDLWDALRSFSGQVDGPWLVGGDFNVVQQHSEVSGGNPQSQSAIDDFNLALLDCGLEDGGYVGSSFTWTNGSSLRRLDRVVVNHLWGSRFPVFSVSHMNWVGSDHSPLLVSCSPSQTKGPSRFKFLHAWLKHLGLMDLIKLNWSLPVSSAGMVGFQQKLIRLKFCLKHWNRTVFGNVFNKVKKAEQDVLSKERAYDTSGSVQDRSALQLAKAHLLQALACEESFLRQQSRVKWIKEGDANSRFFHAMARQKHHHLGMHRI